MATSETCSQLPAEQRSIRTSDIEFEIHVHETTDKMLPAWDILDFVDYEGLALTESFNQRLVKIVGVLRLKTQEAIIFKIDVVEFIPAKSMGHLCQKGGFAHPPQTGDDDSMGNIGCAFDFIQLRTFGTDITCPKGVELLNEHGFDLIFGPAGTPIVFIHNEIIRQIVFIDNENYFVNCSTVWNILRLILY